MRIIIFCLAVLFTLGACAKKELPQEALTETPSHQPAKVAKGQPPKSQAESKLPSPPVVQEQKIAPEEQKALYGRGTLPLKAIFFAFDSYEIRDDMKSRLQEDARYLLAHPEIKVELQGNCDERGSSEYNLALGEKRALMVKRYFVNLGIDPKRLSTVSFGEEKPLAKGHNEKAWALNRRVDLVVINKK